MGCVRAWAVLACWSLRGRRKQPSHRRAPALPPGGGSGAGFRGKRESGVENPYSCVVLGGARSMDERRAALQVG